jgi:shikimate dehydrogenase
VGSAALVVNATSVGLEGDTAVAATMAGPLGAGQLVYDLVYWETPFLVAAADRGATVRHGLGMLVHQAALQVEIHTGSKPPVDVMWEAVADRGTRTLLPPS